MTSRKKKKQWNDGRYWDEKHKRWRLPRTGHVISCFILAPYHRSLAERAYAGNMTINEYAALAIAEAKGVNIDLVLPPRDMPSRRPQSYRNTRKRVAGLPPAPPPLAQGSTKPQRVNQMQLVLSEEFGRALAAEARDLYGISAGDYAIHLICKGLGDNPQHALRRKKVSGPKPKRGE